MNHSLNEGSQNEKLGQIFCDNYQVLYRLAFKLSGNRNDAEDIVQEAFVNALKGWGKFRNESNPLTWLYQITLHCSYRYIKKIHKLPIHVLSETEGTSEAHIFKSLAKSGECEDPLLVTEMREKCLSGFMRCLPTRQRIAFTLRVVLDLSLKDTAAVMETTENNVKVLTHRARRFMQELMENRCSFLNPKNPCRCSIWVKFALEHEIIKKEDAYKFISPGTFSGIFSEEVTVLHKIKVLHQLSVPKNTPEEFLEKIKGLLTEQKLRILS